MVGLPSGHEKAASRCQDAAVNFLGGFGVPEGRLVATATAAATTVAATATAAATTLAAATTVAATATAAATTVAAAACWTIFLRTGFIDGQVATTVIFFVEATDGFIHGGLGVHGHESKATWTTGVAIHRQVNVGNSAVVGEESADVVFCGGEGQVAHVHFSIHIDFLEFSQPE